MGIDEVEELLEGARSLTHLPDSPQGDREQGTAGSSSTESSTTQDHPNAGTGLFISHKLRPNDTIAGLALRYNVSVADIKRANGLLSDSAMYGLDTLHIPTKLLPVGEELQVIFAQVASGFGRDPVLNADANMQPASAAVARVARTLKIVNGENYTGREPGMGGELPWWCQCGMCDEDDVQCQSRRITGSSDPGEVELMERPPTAVIDTHPSLPGGITRMHERMRRRRGTGTRDDVDYGDEDPQGAHSSGAYDSHSFGDWGSSYEGGKDKWSARPPRPGGRGLLSPGSSAVGAAAGSQGPGAATAAAQQLLQGFSDLGKAIGQSSLVQKIRAVASQPALARPAVSSLADAADGVLTSLKEGLLRKGGSDTEDHHKFNSSSNRGGGGTPLQALPRSFNASSLGTPGRVPFKAAGTKSD